MTSQFLGGPARRVSNELLRAAFQPVKVRLQVQDGPFADTKEQLGGYFVIDVADLDTALEWAARAPCAATGGVEVRPVFVAPMAA